MEGEWGVWRVANSGCAWGQGVEGLVYNVRFALYAEEHSEFLSRGMI